MKSTSQLIKFTLCFFFVFMLSVNAQEQKTKKVKKEEITEELKSIQRVFKVNTIKENSCVVEKEFKEPKWNKSSMYKRGRTTVDDLKTHISVDMEVEEKDIILLSLSEQPGNGVYVLCVNGTKMKYKRTGSVFRKDGENVMKLD